MIRFTTAILIILSMPNAFACSFIRTYEEHFPKPTLKGTAPKAPIIETTQIIRGKPGDSGMCADAGLIYLKIKNHIPEFGYKFEIVEGDIEDQLFPAYAVMPYDDELFFVWLDGAKYIQEPVELKVKVTPTSSTGREGEPGYFYIIDKGR